MTTLTKTPSFGAKWPLRKVVAGAAVLVSACYISDCSDHLRAQAKYSPDKIQRMEAVEKLKHNPFALVEIASTGDFSDSRKQAVGFLKDQPYALSEILSETRCMDTRTAALNALTPQIDDLSDLNGLCAMAGLSRGTARDKVKLRVAILEEKDELGDDTTDTFMGNCVASYSTSNSERQQAVARFKRDKDTDNLENLALTSEYPDTRKAAAAASESLGHAVALEPSPTDDISRFSDCHDGTKKPSGGPTKKPWWKVW